MATRQVWFGGRSNPAPVRTWFLRSRPAPRTASCSRRATRASTTPRSTFGLPNSTARGSSLRSGGRGSCGANGTRRTRARLESHHSRVGMRDDRRRARATRACLCRAGRRHPEASGSHSRWLTVAHPPPEDPDADSDGDPGGCVEQAVPERVRLQSGNSRVRIVALTRQHVVPLEDLVEHDPIDEAAETDAEQYSWGARAQGRLVRLAYRTLLPGRSSTLTWPV